MWLLRTPHLLSEPLEILDVCVPEALRALGIPRAGLGFVQPMPSLLHGFECWLVCKAGKLLERDLCFVFNEEREE